MEIKDDVLISTRYGELGINGINHQQFINVINHPRDLNHTTVCLFVILVAKWIPLSNLSA